MNRSRAAFSFAISCLAWMPVVAHSQEASLGATEFRVHCAACHGFLGTGMGPYAEMLAFDTPDLTVLSKDNGGVFPSARVHEVIDGRKEVAIHGPREMPIWGDEYNAEAANYYREVWKIEDPETMIRDRIDALVAYIESLQKP